MVRGSLCVSLPRFLKLGVGPLGDTLGGGGQRFEVWSGTSGLASTGTPRGHPQNHRMGMFPRPMLKH